ncbi:hypothetical protein EJ06DRAFT_534435 [Trichodelitschia bisporula]|uniref:Uncharacterized protein n=1 Tax=Trichodelitschia bisporula TaxID=703511 RepID=A0A6G1HIV7_9PEZI|nr:hypothetical protein EJ06DRAFT_534435 [Trichodelitschia bisporula]
MGLLRLRFGGYVEPLLGLGLRSGSSFLAAQNQTACLMLSGLSAWPAPTSPPTTRAPAALALPCLSPAALTLGSSLLGCSKHGLGGMAAGATAALLAADGKPRRGCCLLLQLVAGLVREGFGR